MNEARPDVCGRAVSNPYRKASVLISSTSPESSSRLRLAALGLAGALLAAPLVIASIGPATAHPLDEPEPAAVTTAASYADAQVGDLVDVRIGDVHPTQPSVGYDEVYYKLGRYSELGKDAVNKRFGDWCEANGQLDAVAADADATLHDPASFTCALPLGGETEQSIAEMKTVVIGPEGALYLTDGHHTLTSFAETADGGLNLHVRLRVTANLSDQAPAQFWQTMIANQWTWLEQVDGAPITPADLPASVGLGNFADDPNRSLLYFARDIGFASGTIPFQEFYWGAWVRDAQPVDLSGWNTNDRDSYLATVRSLSEAQVALDPAAPIAGGFTAADLGVLSAWNDGKAEAKGEWNKLSQPYDAEKPGKLAYAMAYKSQLPPSGEEPGGEEPPVDPGTVHGALAVSGDLRPGGEITVSGSGFAPSTTGYSLEMRSEPVQLAEVSTDETGAFAATVTLPRAAGTGSHRIALLWNGVEVGATEVQIEADARADGDAGAGAGGSGAGGPGEAGGTAAGGNSGAGATPVAAQAPPAAAKLAETGGAPVIAATTAALAMMLVGGAVTVLHTRRRRAE
ncbi:ParB/Srx family N-terminal domain-containing protein [Leucobacter manosquensis]|uniref:ParB/Srx family N-terminal domain-containing protein n=1 Tax=Leucobacter manosquensis TaxID=2810611 RepID=A0ABS5M1D9_9MICO|nr:ParB/Srx family N-terminal domain-containing protein [Leucobacter manosquensis]MBS3180998.1 ParB/Srx family N-terminal domain-containing protein [Leucobacter manosquensis]